MHRINIGDDLRRFPQEKLNRRATKAAGAASDGGRSGQFLAHLSLNGARATRPAARLRSL
jgi:hypothetical protein